MDATADELIARLRRNPDDVAAYGALRTHYHRLGDFASLVNLVEGWANRVQDPLVSSQSFFEAGEFAWGALRDQARGMSFYDRALQRNGAHSEAYQRLAQMFEAAGDFPRLAELTERHADALTRTNTDPRVVAALHQRLGELWEQTFQRADKAVLHYRRAFELDPMLVPAIYAAREIYRRANNLKAVAQLLDLEVKAEPDGERRLALLRELAHLRLEALGDVEGALNALKRATNENAGNVELQGDLVRVYLARADRAQDPMVADADRRRAADALWTLAQQQGPTEAVESLSQALDVSPDHEGALALLERIAERVGHFELLPPRWVAFLARAPQAPGAKERRRRLAHAYLEAGQVDYAISCFEWLLEEGDGEAADALVGLYRQVGREADVARALEVAARSLPPAQRGPRLREMMTIAISSGDAAAASQHARGILEIDPADPEALAFLESDLRKRGQWGELREMLLAAVRVPGMSTDARKQRLREVAQISERRLSDLAGAISAHEGVVAIDAADRDARGALMRLYEAAQRWDDLAQLIEREVAGQPEASAQVELLRRLSEVHRDKRGDLDEAIGALRALRALAPHDRPARDALCDLLVQKQDDLDAIPLLEERAAQSAPGHARAQLRRTLAAAYERIGEEEQAFGAFTRLLDDEPRDLEALERMATIDQRSGNAERLLSTLTYRADLEQGAERAATLRRMGDIADAELRDLDRAAELYARALELAPSDEALLDALSSAYQRAERYKDLVVLLRDRARRESDVGSRAAIYRRIARTLKDRVQNLEGAAEAYHEVLAAGEDVEALTFLKERARAAGDLEGVGRLIERLANVAGDAITRRDLMIERATLLADELGRPEEAIGILREVVRDVDPSHLPALGQMGDLAEAIGDHGSLAEALERTLAVLEDPGLRVPVAQRLADLCENELRDAARAIDALDKWSEADLMDAAPLRRLLPLLEAQQRWQPLVAALDQLADLEDDDAAAGVAVRRAADLAAHRLGDVDRAWGRLVPRVAAGDEEAEAMLRTIARESSRGPALVELYTTLAADAESPDVSQRRYLDAAKAEEEFVGRSKEALELVLKAFGVAITKGQGPTDLRLLDEADRLAAAAAEFARLAQVYETLVRRAEDRDQKVKLLVRLARVLEEKAEDPGGALDRALRACSLTPNDDAVLAFAESLAEASGRTEELLVVYDRRRKDAQTDAGRVEALLRAAVACEERIPDRERAVHFVAQAVALSARDASVVPRIEEACRTMTSTSEPPMIEALVGVYAQLGADMDSDPRAGAVLLGHAARLLDQELSRPEAAYDVLVRATTLAPFDDAAHEALDALAVKLKRTKALDAHLGKLVEDALDGKTAGALIRRRAALLTREGKHADAAEAWTRLKNLQPNDEAVRAELRAALRRAGKHQDLLLALGQDLNKAKDPAAKLAIAREVAETWDRDLKNKWEAIEAWTKVLSLDPEDAAAKDAIARLKGGGRPLASDDDEAGETVPGTRKRDQATTELKLDGQGEPGSSESEAELSSLDASDVDEVTTGSLLLPEARGEAEADSLESAVQAEPAEATPMPPPLAPLAPPAPKTSAAPITGFDTDEETLLGASDALAQAEELAPLAAPSPSETAILSDADDEDTRLGRPIRPESEELGQAPTQLRELDAPLGVPLRAREAPLDGGDVLGDEVEELEPEADEEGIEELDGAVEEADVLGDGDDAVEEMEAGGLDALDAMLDRRASSRPPPPPSGPPRPSAAPPPPPPGARMSRPPPPPPPAPPKKK